MNQEPDLSGLSNMQVCDLEDAMRNPEQFADNPFAEQAAKEAIKPKKASPLTIITRGKKIRPFMSVVAGGPGIGKSTLGAHADGSIFIPTERGLDQIGAERFPMPATYLEFKRFVHAIDTEPHDYKTLVIDTIDGLETLICAEVCEEKNCASIEEPGWGEGYTAAQTKWRSLLKKLVNMSERFNILLLSHVHIKTFNDPSMTDPYDVWRIKLQEKSGAAVKEACDNILFACHDQTMVKNKGKDKDGEQKARGPIKVLHSGERILKTRASMGYPDCKNRYGLEEEIPLEWGALANGVREFYEK